MYEYVCICACMCTGTADVVCVGCVWIGDSSSREVEEFTSSSAGRGQPSPWVDPVISGIDYELHRDWLKECSVVFDTVNPHNAAYKTIVIVNHRSTCIV